MPYLEAMTSQQRDEGCPNSKSAQNVATNASYFSTNFKDGSDVSFVSYHIPGFIAGHTGDFFSDNNGGRSGSGKHFQM